MSTVVQSVLGHFKKAVIPLLIFAGSADARESPAAAPELFSERDLCYAGLHKRIVKDAIRRAQENGAQSGVDSIFLKKLESKPRFVDDFLAHLNRVFGCDTDQSRAINNLAQSAYDEQKPERKYLLLQRLVKKFISDGPESLNHNYVYQKFLSSARIILFKHLNSLPIEQAVLLDVDEVLKIFSDFLEEDFDRFAYDTFLLDFSVYFDLPDDLITKIYNEHVRETISLLERSIKEYRGTLNSPQAGNLSQVPVAE